MILIDSEEDESFATTAILDSFIVSLCVSIIITNVRLLLKMLMRETSGAFK